MNKKIIIEKPDIALESSLLSVMAIKDNLTNYLDTIDKNQLLENTRLLLKDYEKYFELHKEHEHIDWGIFYTDFSQDWHSHDLDNQEIKYYKDHVIPAIQRVTNADAEICIQSLNKRAFEIAIRDTTDPDKLIELANQFKQQQQSKSEIEEDGDNIFTLDFTVLDKSNGIPLFLPSLQSNLGSLVLGQFIVVAADANTGKSAFVISQLTHSFKHLVKINDSRPILYFNSEGTSEEVIDRFFSNLYYKKYSDGFEEIHENQTLVVKEFQEQYPEHSKNLWIFPISKINTFEKVKEKILKYQPALVIIDICDKLAPEEDATSLKKLYDNLRVLSADICPIIGTSQSGNQEYFDKETNQLKSRKWLTDKALYGAKQKGGAADTMIMIGKDEGEGSVRYVSVTKNKRGKPTKITCEFIAKFSRYQELDW